MDRRQTLAEAASRARALATSGQRRLLGIVGPPGGGKSTIATAVVDELSPLACYVPMDGFHLANRELERLGRRYRKGAPDTFDAAGYVALLRRLRERGADVVYAPEFDRELDEPVAAAIHVPPEAALIVTEGNYLLLDDGPWAQVRPLLDETWYVQIDEAVRLDQLVRRHVAFGMTPEAATAWAYGTDQRNARLVEGTLPRADLIVRPSSVAPDRKPPGDPGDERPSTTSVADP